MSEVHKVVDEPVNSDERRDDEIGHQSDFVVQRALLARRRMTAGGFDGQQARRLRRLATVRETWRRRKVVGRGTMTP